MSISFVAFRPVGFLLDCEQYEQSSVHPPVLRTRTENHSISYTAMIDASEEKKAAHLMLRSVHSCTLVGS
jgi:hypothetical protein